MARSRRLIPFKKKRQLEIWTARSPGAAHREPEAYVLEFCGNASRAEYVATDIAWRWGKHPVEAWVVNYPGYGGSTGRASLKSIPRASLTAYDALSEEAEGRPIFACGNSLGTCAALYVAAQRSVAGLILQNPPPLRHLIIGKYGWWNLWIGASAMALEIPGHLDSLRNAPKVEAPGLFLLARHDELVLPRFQRRVVNAFGGPKRSIHFSGGHNSPIEGPTVDELHTSIDWLWLQAGLTRKHMQVGHHASSPIAMKTPA